MILNKADAFENDGKGEKPKGLNLKRFERDSLCVDGFKKVKEENQKKIDDGRAAAQAEFMGRKDL